MQTKKEYSLMVARLVATFQAMGMAEAEIIRLVVAQTGCHRRTVLRRLARPGGPSSNWGGQRPGAGYPKGRPRSVEDRRNRRRSPLTNAPA